MMLSWLSWETVGTIIGVLGFIRDIFKDSEAEERAAALAAALEARAAFWQAMFLWGVVIVVVVGAIFFWRRHKEHIEHHGIAQKPISDSDDDIS